MTPSPSVAEGVAGTVLDEIRTLHDLHGETAPDGRHRVSVGLVRMANIDPLVQVARAIAEAGCASMDVHLCVYHARHPLYRRARIERVLDDLLDRHEPARLWDHPSVVKARRRERRDQVFVVLATAVAEVGRDHCYDWAIVEPSSMRSIVQLGWTGAAASGRTGFRQRPNVVLLRRNVRALKNADDTKPAFTEPGLREGPAAALRDTIWRMCSDPGHYEAPECGQSPPGGGRPRPRTFVGRSGARRHPAGAGRNAGRRAVPGEPVVEGGDLVVLRATGAHPIPGRRADRSLRARGGRARCGARASSASRKASGSPPISSCVPRCNPPRVCCRGHPRAMRSCWTTLDEEHDGPLDRTCRRYLSLSLRRLEGVDYLELRPVVGRSPARTARVERRASTRVPGALPARQWMVLGGLVGSTSELPARQCHRWWSGYSRLRRPFASECFTEGEGLDSKQGPMWYGAVVAVTMRKKERDRCATS